MKQLRFSLPFLAASVVLFATELLIALFAKGFVRHYVGDVLVVILLYCAVRTFYKGAPKRLPLYLFLFATLVEVAQACRLTELLSMREGSALTIAIGTSFDWVDIGCYALGAVLCFLHTYGCMKRPH